MAWKWNVVFSCAIWFGCCSFLAVHYSQMKTPSQYREIASSHQFVKPWYDASWKY